MRRWRAASWRGYWRLNIMTDDDKWRFADLMRLTASVTVLPNGKTVESIMPSLFEGLRQYDFTEVEDATKRYCRGNRFFPMLADIVGLIEGNDTEKALKLWTLVVRAIENIGHWHNVRFPVPAVHAAIENMGGWVWLATHLTYDNAPFLQKEFERHIISALRHPATVGNRPYLPGIDENARNERSRPLEVIDALTGETVSQPALRAPVGSAKQGLPPAKPVLELVAAKMKLN